MNGTGNGNSNAFYLPSEYSPADQAPKLSEKRPFVPINETFRRLDTLSDECVKISEALTMALFAVEQEEAGILPGVCFADDLNKTADKMARIKSNLLVLADGFGIQV